jgi:hypothetical protein
LEIASETYIERGAFRLRTALQSVALPKWGRIGVDAFFGCAALEKVQSSAEYVVLIEIGAFAGCTALETVSVAWLEGSDPRVRILRMLFARGI